MRHSGHWGSLNRVQCCSEPNVAEKLDNKFKHNEREKLIYFTGLKESIEYEKIKRFIALTLLTETSVNIEEYGGHSEFLVSLTAVVYKCQTDNDSTDGKGYGQPQAVAKWCNVTPPCYVGVVG
jgi:hypothetical protein